MELVNVLSGMRKELFERLSKVMDIYDDNLKDDVNTVLLQYFERADREAIAFHHSPEGIQNSIDALIHNGSEPESLSDGYHSFKELYDHRIQLWISNCKLWDESHSDSVWDGNGPKNYVWRSQKHSDGSEMENWFLLGINKGEEQLTYHLPFSEWSACAFARTLEQAPEYDGHTSADVLERLKEL